MNQKEAKGDMPNYKGSIKIAAWVNQDKNGNEYLSIVLSNRAALFPVDKDTLGKDAQCKEFENVFD